MLILRILRKILYILISIIFIIYYDIVVQLCFKNEDHVSARQLHICCKLMCSHIWIKLFFVFLFLCLVFILESDFSLIIFRFLQRRALFGVKHILSRIFPFSGLEPETLIKGGISIAPHPLVVNKLYLILFCLFLLIYIWLNIFVNNK